MTMKKCWGLFKTAEHKTPAVYCVDEHTANLIKNSKVFAHYDKKYKDYVIKEIH